MPHNTLRDVFPEIEELPKGNVWNDRLRSYLDMDVIYVCQRDQGGWKEWPGPQKHVHTWVKVFSECLVGWNHRWGCFKIGRRIWAGRFVYYIQPGYIDEYRDFQKQKVYDAEYRARDFPIKYRTDFKTIEEASGYVQFLRRRDWFKVAWPKTAEKHIPVKFKKGTWNQGGQGGMDLTRNGYTQERIILHELAHVITKMEYPEVPEAKPGHGSVYCDVLLYLHLQVKGECAWSILMAEFDRGGVKYSTDLIDGFREAASKED